MKVENLAEPEYKVTVTREQTVGVTKQSWGILKDSGDGKYGSHPSEEVETRAVTFYEQRVASLDLGKVIAAVNGL